MKETNFKETELGLIPKDWTLSLLPKLCSIKARIGWQGLTTDEYLDSGDYVLITGTDFKNGFIDWNNCHYVSEWRYQQDRKIQIRKGDVLITKDGTIGKVAYLDKIPMDGTLNSGVFVIRTKDIDSLRSEYLSYFFKSIWFESFVNQLTAGSTIVHLYQKDIVKLQVLVPPTTEEQTRIATALSDMDSLIQKTEELLEKKRNIKQGTMQQLLTGKKRLKGFTGEWKTICLKNVGEPCMCKRILKEQTTEYGEIPFYKIGTFGQNADAYISKQLFLDYKKRFNYPKCGDVLISAAGTIGRRMIFDGNDSYFQDSNIVWIRNDEKVMTNIFFYYIINVIKWNSTEGGTISRLYNSNIKETEICIPSTLKEQNKIATILSDMDKEIEEIEKKLIKLRDIKQGMMQQLLTGKIRLV